MAIRKNLPQSLLTGLRSWWGFNEWGNESGLAVRVDELGHNHVSPVGGPVRYKDGANWGARKSAAFFDPAVASYLQTAPAADNLTDQNVTLAFRLRLFSVPADGDFFGIFWKSLPGMRIELHNDGGDVRLRFLRTYSPLPGTDFEVWSEPLANPLTYAKWFLVIAWTDFENNKIAIQVDDGEPSIASTMESPLDALGDLIFGAWGDGSHVLNGGIDEFGLWLRALTADEKTYLFEQRPARTYEDLLPVACSKSITCCQ